MGQTGVLTAVANGKTYTQSIQACKGEIVGPPSVCNTATYYLNLGQASKWQVTSSAFSIVSSTSTSVTISTSSSNGETASILATYATGGVTSRGIVASCGRGGNNESDLDAFVLVYPNPASDILNIEIDAAHALDLQSRGIAATPTYDIRLYDGQINLQRRSTSKGGNAQLNVSNLPNGIYYLHINDGVSKPVMRQIIVEH